MYIEFNTFNKLIYYKRIQKGITQKQLANMVNVTQAYISYIENGFKIPSNKVLKSICKQLDITPFEITKCIDLM